MYGPGSAPGGYDAPVISEYRTGRKKAFLERLGQGSLGGWGEHICTGPPLLSITRKWGQVG